MKNKIFAIILMLILALPVVADEPQAGFKQPISKRKIAKKFLLAMGGVGASSIVLYIGLTAYNQIKDGFKVSAQEPEESLESPETLDSAVKIFLKKTDWK